MEPSVAIITLNEKHGAQNILFEGIWLDIKTLVGTPHKIKRKMILSDNNATLWLHLAS